jgi:predicted dehydrogenase
LETIAKIGGADVVAFCDIVPERAKNAAEKYGAPEALVCTDYREVLKRDDIDAVHVCTPNNTHAEITVAALKSGKHVMCEKPMAVTGAEAQSMLDASRETGKKLTIGYQNRFRDDSLFIKSLCSDGVLGDIYYAKALATRRRMVPTWGVFMDKEKQGGGPLIDIATHALDMTLWMMDNYEPALVLGSTYDKIGKMGSEANGSGPWNPAEYDVEDSAFGVVKFKNGASVTIESSWALNMIISHEAMTLLCGTKAGADMFPPAGPQIRVGDWQAESSYHVRVNGEKNGKLYVQNYNMGESFLMGEAPEQFAGATKEMQAWFDSLKNEADLVVKPEQACVVTTILEAVYKSAATGEAIKF